MQNLKSELEEAILKKVMTEQFNQDADMKPIEQEKTPVNVEDILDNNLITGVTQKMMDDGFDIKSDEIKKLFANEVVNRLSQTTETNDSTSFLMKKFPHLQSQLPVFTNPYNVARKPVKNQFSEHEESNPNTDYNTQMFVSRVDMTLDNFVKNIAWKVREMNKEYERNEDNLMRNYKILPHQEISNLNVNSTLNMNPYHYKIFR